MPLDIDTEAFRSFAYFGAILGLKVMGMSVLTAVNRIRKRAFANPEDLIDPKKEKTTLSDPDVERVRRAHLNDLENILPFLILGLLYCFTHPSAATANTLFKVFTIARIAHTFVYAVVPIPQPARVLAFAVGYGINIYMAIKVLTYFA